MQRCSSLLIGLTLLIAPLSVSALDGFPAFPMAFWGAVTINGSAAPVDTIVRAYYGSTLAEEVTVHDSGVYGYTEPSKQKLVVAEGTGELTFKVVASGFNGGAETSGTAAVTYAGFIAGETISKNLTFTITVPVPAPPAPSGGGGGDGSVAPTPAPVVPVIATTTQSTSTTPVLLPTITTPPQGQVLGTTVFNFTRNLQKGSSGNDVIELQKILIAKGYLKISAPTGYFGVLTVAAVKLYQKNNSLEQVGNVGPKTRALLNVGATPALTELDKAALIKTLLAQVQLLLAQIETLKAQQATSTPH